MLSTEGFVDAIVVSKEATPCKEEKKEEIVFPSVETGQIQIQAQHFYPCLGILIPFWLSRHKVRANFFFY